MSLPAVVFNTDERWFSHFRPDDRITEVDEVNFWRPAAQSEFRRLQPGEPIFFRLKKPYNAIAGFGFFAVSSLMTIELAWEIFGDRNGDATEGDFQRRLREYRLRHGSSTDAPLRCLVLRDAVLLPRDRWLPWGTDEEWSRNIVAYKGYDLATGPGRSLGAMLRSAHPAPVPDLQSAFEPLKDDQRDHVEVTRRERLGQGTFRLRLRRAYRGQCAVTGEHAVPVLEAAHIQPYLGPASNHPQNGIVLRSDLHRLYDRGYVTVTPELRLEVSGRLREEFENGKPYYDMAGQRVRVPPEAHLVPSAQALGWHAENVFR
jgi:putative restriction endonuclease